MEEIPLGARPAPLRVKHPRLRIALIVSVVVALALAAYLLAVLKMPLPGALGQYWSAFTLPAELRSAVLMSASPRGTDLYEHVGMRYEKAGNVAGVVRGLAMTQYDGYAALVSDAEAGVQRIVIDGAAVVEGASIRSLAASPDGRRLAYAETADGSAYASDPAAWVVKIYYPDPETTQTVGPGFAPFFIDDTTLGYFTAAGVFAVNLETGAPASLLAEPFLYAHEVVLVSPDRRSVAWQTADGQLHAYAIAGGALEPVAAFRLADEVQGASAPTLGDAGFYTVRATNNGSEVWRRGFDGALARIAVLPPALETTRLMFTSN